MRIGFFQFAPVFGEVKTNVEYAIRRLSGLEADLMVLPELFTSGYQFVSKQEVRELAEEIPKGPTTSRLIELARDRKMIIAAGLPERKGKRYFNSSVLVGPKGFITVYRKIHLFYEEKLWFSPGDIEFRVHHIGGVRIGIMVCFDWFFPESVRSLALSGAEIICHPSNLVLPYCPDAMVIRCLENRVFAVTANRIGAEQRGGKPPLTYIGQSEVVNPKGMILYRAKPDEEDIAVVEVNPKEARNKRINTYNDLFRDRRTKFYKR
ncbi:MAG TPA: nitrilase-related carbon-nitrogen hydrolase [Nitrospiria bacterium]|jgi:predicted amidohydrolase|nr:nitrilase-related carbon-nitrogen hydrolase [Nitrospiria bacterium]